MKRRAALGAAEALVTAQRVMQMSTRAAGLGGVLFRDDVHLAPWVLACLVQKVPPEAEVRAVSVSSNVALRLGPCRAPPRRACCGVAWRGFVRSMYWFGTRLCTRVVVVQHVALYRKAEHTLGTRGRARRCLQPVEEHTIMHIGTATETINKVLWHRGMRPRDFACKNSEP